MNPYYKTITGRVVDTKAVNKPEAKLLEAIVAEFEKNPSWDSFSGFWQESLRSVLSKISGKTKTQHPLYQIAQDLELRLGIAQQKVAPPDYRDYLLDQIEERFGSRYKFCKATKIPEAFLSQVLSGKKEFSLKTLHVATEALGLGLMLLPKADFTNPLQNDLMALQKVAAITAKDLARVKDLYDNLSRYDHPGRRLESFAAEHGIIPEPIIVALSKEIETISGTEAKASKLLECLKVKEAALEYWLASLREKIASLVDTPSVISKGDRTDASSNLLRV